MRYVTWSLTWENGYGFGPEQTAKQYGATLSGAVASPNVETGTILGYLDGELDLALVADWGVTEVTETEALDFARALNAQAFLNEDGLIGFPFEEL